MRLSLEKRRWAWVVASLPMALLAGLLGCLDDTTNVDVLQPPVQASLTARVLSYPDLQPIPAAQFELVGMGQSGAADAQGTLNIGGMTAGSYALRVSASGYATTSVGFTVDPTDSGTPSIHLQRTIYLLERTAGLRLLVRTGTDGNPAAGVTMDLYDWDFPDAAVGHSVDDATVPRTVQTDTSGSISLAGLPATTLTVSVRPYDANHDGNPEYGTTVGYLNLVREDTLSLMLVLQPRSDAIQIVYTNVSQYYQGTVYDSEVFFVFSTEMDTTAAATHVLLRDYYTSDPIPVTVEWTSPVRLEITPGRVLSDPSKQYSLSLSVRSEAGTRYSTDLGYFRWISTGTPEPGVGTCDSVVSDLRLSPAQDPIDFDTRTVELIWPAVECAGGYRIYAMDDRDNPSWTFLKNEPTDFETGLVSTWCTLPAAFDRYQVDNVQTPFAGTQVTFCVVPARASNPNPGGSHGVVEVRDQVAPGVPALWQVGDGRNDTASPALLLIGVTFDEYISPATPDPVLIVEEAGGTPYHLNPAAGTWVWEAGRRSGRFAFTLPAGADASGDRVWVQASGVQDLSDNSAPTLTTDPMIVLAVGGQYDFESSEMGWTRTGEGWAWGTPTVGPGGAHSGSNCWGTNLAGTYGADWNTTLTSPTILVPSTAPSLSLWYWYSMSYDDRCILEVAAPDTVVQLRNWYGSDGTWRQQSYSLQQFAGRGIQLRFRFTSDSSTSSWETGFFLDDVMVTGSGD